jgi:hypothetical protein
MPFTSHHLRLLDDYLTLLPQLDAAAEEADLLKLGFLSGPIPIPIVDGPAGSEAYRDSFPAARHQSARTSSTDEAIDQRWVTNVREVR